MEYAVFNLIPKASPKEALVKLRQLRQTLHFGRKLERVYLGAESCVRLLPTLSQLERHINQVQEAGYGFTFVIPAMVSEFEVGKIRKLLGFLAGGKRKVEVVINDWGVLSLAQEYDNLVLILGRLLNKRERDPRVDYKKLPPWLLRILRGSMVDDQRWLGFLKAKRIVAIEYDNVRQGLAATGDLMGVQLHLYYPHVVASLSRECIYSSTTKAGPSLGGCQRSCLDYFVQREISGPAGLKATSCDQLGKGIYYENDEMPKGLGIFSRCIVTSL